jgi:hypothetical protein
MVVGSVGTRPDRDRRLVALHLAGLIVGTALGIAFVLGALVAAVLILVASAG